MANKIFENIGLLLVELITETLLLGVFFGFLLAKDVGALQAAIAGIVISPIVLGLNGYYVSRIFAALGWLANSSWIYVLLACLAFNGHLSYLAYRMMPGITPPGIAEALPFFLGGTLIVMVCSSAGSRFRARI